MNDGCGVADLQWVAGPLIGLRYLATTAQQPDRASVRDQQPSAPWRPLDGFNVTGMPSLESADRPASGGVR